MNKTLRLRISLQRILVSIFSGIALSAFSQTPALDPGFGNGGIVKANLGYGGNSVYGTEILHDDKIIIMSKPYPYSYSFDLQRLNADGTIDKTFGDNGKMTYPFSLGADFWNMVKDSSDKLILLGYSIPYNDTNFIVMMRLLQDGSIDSSFGTNGIKRLNFGSTLYDLDQIALTPDQGFLLRAGFSNNPYTIIKLNEEGDLDSSFNKTGIFAISQVHGKTRLITLAPEPDGKIIVALTINNRNILLLLNADGTIDYSFKADWIKQFEEFSYPTGIEIKAISADKILVLKYSYNNGVGSSYFIAQMLGSGQIDSSFGSNGFIFSDVSKQEIFLDFTTDKMGRIITTGAILPNSDFLDTAVFKRFSPNGIIDNLFGYNGETKLGYSSGAGWSSFVQLQSNGNIIGTGFYFQREAENDAVVSLLPDGKLNSDFASKGVEVLPDGESDDYVHEIVVLPDHNIIPLCGLETSNKYSYDLTKLNSEGSIDSSFALNGVFIDGPDSENTFAFGSREFVLPDNEIEVIGLYIGSVNYLEGDYAFFTRVNENGLKDSAYGINGTAFGKLPYNSNHIMDAAIQPDGKILVNFVNPGGPDILSRFNEDGSLDPTFGKSDTVQEFKLSAFESDKLQIQENREILVSNCGNNGLLAKRYFSNGVIDKSYGIDGTAGVSGLSFTAIFNSFLTPDNKLLLLAEGTTEHDFILIAIDSTGRLDTSFNKVGYYSESTDSNRYWMQYITVSPDLADYIVTGTYSNSGHNYLDIFTLTKNGKRDSLFGLNGELKMPIFGNDQGNFIKFTSDNSMLVGGEGTSLTNTELYYGVDIFILKFLPIIATSTITLPQPDNKFILVYPTPLHDYATIQFDSPKSEKVNFVLFNQEGGEINSWNNIQVQAGQNSETLSFNNLLPGGWYTLQLIGNNFSESVRIIKQ